MNYGFLRVAALSPRLRVADCDYNAGQMIAAMQAASDQGARIAVFPELGLTGYTCGDLFGQRALQEGALMGLERIVKASAALDMVVVAGLPLVWNQKLYNCAAVLCRGGVLGVVPKQHLPNYGEFYERRQFTPAVDGNVLIPLLGREVPFGTRLLFACGDCPELVLAAEICEDAWVPVPPSAGHAMAGATVIVNPSASDETVGKAEYRRELLRSLSARLVCGYLYAGAGEGESTTDLVFSGHSLIAENGSLLAEAPPFAGNMAITELDVQRLAAERQRMTTFVSQRPGGYQVIPFSLEVRPVGRLIRQVPMLPFVPGSPAGREARCRAVLDMQAAGLRRRIEHTRCQRVVIGVSGGLDSTLALLAAARALDGLERPRSDLLTVTMPCFGTTSRTRQNAEALCNALGAELRTVDITASVRQHFADIGQAEDSLDLTFENSQARERTQVLMDLANQQGGLVVGTGDLSELALGWATYNGDHMSMYGVNASIPKTLVRHLVEYAAGAAGEGALRSTLLDVLDTPVSPELLPAREGEISQRTEDIVGPYELHDFFLYYLVRFGFTPDKILFLAVTAFEGVYDQETIRRWLKVFVSRFFSQQFKRSCLPDGPKVGSVTLSPRGDWRMPSDAWAALWTGRL